jgi:RNA polymerase sigma-70 factor (sigma-E family)
VTRTGVKESALGEAPTVVMTFEDFYATERTAVQRLAWLLTDDVDDAADVVQDAFSQVFERWDHLENPAAYVRTCVVNGARRRHRRRNLEVTLLRHRRTSNTPPPDDPLLDAIGHLPMTLRSVVVLRFYEGRGETEMAALLGVPPGTVKSRLHRALAQLRGEIER